MGVDLVECGSHLMFQVESIYFLSLIKGTIMLFALPALNDNYIWLYQRENLPLIIVDLPETDKLFTWLDKQT